MGGAREIKTIDKSIDAILAGEVFRAGDILMQRVRSCETLACETLACEPFENRRKGFEGKGDLGVFFQKYRYQAEMLV